MRTRRLAAMVPLLAAILATAACAGSTVPSHPAPPPAITLFGTDGVMTDALGDGLPAGRLSGMSGTSPISALDAGFQNRLTAFKTSLTNYAFAGQAYDAVVISALAAQIGRSTQGTTIASYLIGVTTKQSGGVTCTAIADCLADIAAGTDVAYRGPSITNGMDSAGQPSVASYGVLHFGANNTINPQQTEYVSAGAVAAASTKKPPAPAPIVWYGGPALRIGLLLPSTGALASGGRPQTVAAKMAIADLNAAGGILNRQVQAVYADEGATDASMVAAADGLIAHGVDVIVGASTSTGAAAVLPLAAKAGIPLLSPSATAASLAVGPDHDVFFRTAPSDDLQAQAIADVVVRSGAQRVYVVAPDDAYGTGLEHAVVAALAVDGVAGTSATTSQYSADPAADNRSTFSKIATLIGEFRPDAVVLIGHGESAGLITAMADAHLRLSET